MKDADGIEVKLDTEILTAFMELNRKIDSNFKDVNTILKDSCERISKVEIAVTNHLTTQIEKQNFRFKFLTVIIGIIGSSVAILNIARLFNVI